MKRARKHALIQEYKMFRMLKGETISDVQKIFTYIVNRLIGLCKIFERERLNIKILKCLDRSWQPKVTTISKSKDFTTLTTTSFFEELREHELEMNCLHDQEKKEKHVKSIALKYVAQKVNQDSSDYSDSETLNLLTKKFGKFLKKKSREKNQPSNRYNSKKVNEFNFTNYTWFGCGKQGDIKADCPKNESKEKGLTRSLQREANQEKPTSLGKIMMTHPQVHHQRKMKKSICV